MITLRGGGLAIIANVTYQEPAPMAMPQTIPWTRADLDRFPDDGNRYEVVNGELLVTPPPSEMHEVIAAWLNARLTPYVFTHGLGLVHHPRSVIVAGDSLVEPDLMVRPVQREYTGWERVSPPILVIEILSSSTRRRDTMEKREFYANRRIPDYWIVDRFSRTVIRYAGGTETTEGSTIVWEPLGAPEPMRIDLSQLWADTQDRERRLPG